MNLIVRQKEIGWLLKEKYLGKPTKQFYKDVERIKAGEPVDYVIGFIEFLGCRIDLLKKPLIPRPETEFWVSKALAEFRIQNTEFRILDIFAGSGCIGLAILKHVKNATVFFADKYQYFDSPNFIKSDVFSNVKDKFDYVFANPPYIPKTNKNRIQKSVLQYEPKTALFGGQDGFFYIKKFLKQAKRYLNPTSPRLRQGFDGQARIRGARIFMEFSPEQKKGIERLLKTYGYTAWEFHKDQFKRWRWVEIY